MGTCGRAQAAQLGGDPEGWDGEVGGRLPREGIEMNTAGKAIILQWKRFLK